MSRSIVRLIGRCALLTPLLLGCEGLDWSFKSQPAEPKPEATAAKDDVTGDTVGDVTLLGDSEGLRVRGFGVVIGLGENGSADCPSAIREYLVETLNKEFGQGQEGQGSRFSAQRLIDSLDTAVVEVQGIVAPGAAKSARFDVSVQAIPGTQTRSLQGGMLIPTDLRVFDVSAGGAGMLAGAVVARARGPVFVSPFTEGEGLGDARRGSVLGGGWTLDARPARLLLEEPSYPTARQIERRLNERFGPRPRVAEALSQGYVEVRTPAEFSRAPERFLRLAAHLYLQGEGGYQDLKLRELCELVVKPDAKYDNIALAWEALGRNALPRVQPLYGHESDAVSFHATRAGMRLKDAAALPVMARIAATPAHAYRLPAVRELGESQSSQAVGHLATLLDDPDQVLRIAAYEALLTMRTPRVQSRRFPHALDPSQMAFTLDVVDSRAKPLIYVRRTGEPRIAVFGPRLALEMPLFFDFPGGLVTLDGQERGDVAIIGQTRDKRPLPSPLSCAPRVVDLIVTLADAPVLDKSKKLRGAGLDYSQVVQVLANLVKQQHIAAPLVSQQAPASELLGPTPQRPETDDAAPVAPFEPRPERDADSSESPPLTPGKAAPLRR